MAALIKSGSSSSVRRGNDDSWKAQAFLNFYLPGAEGPMKLGSIPLKEANDDQASLIAALVKDPELLAKLLSKLTVTFQQVKASTGGYKLD